ncbi:tripartite motif-containing protein 16-like protein [Melanotaenia boesemani]|uniref:tripartite motif-containing protein 16-like protein n=1 Tax=Melanotaenia boesemani TaxID=1250792 RepID=UPI001C042246|nr:tripartite motif-containing protein 16-like protein [Melanotaenia boesemani]
MAEFHMPVRMNRLSCRICRELLRNPATIPCGHKFCLDCIQDCWERDKLNCSCPECGQKFPYRPHLIKNTTLVEVARDTEETESRKRKEQLSAESLQALKRHRSSTETSGKPLCPRHKIPLDVYCCTDNHILCALCASTKHSGHRFGLVMEERRRKQEELRKVQTKLRETLQEQEKKWENMGEMSEQIQVEARQTEDYCESAIVRVIDCLQRRYMSVKQLIGAQVEAAAAQVHISKQMIQMKIEKMKAQDAHLECLAQTEPHAHFLQKWPRVQRLCEKDYLQPFHDGLEDLFLPFEDTKKAVEQLGKRLEEFCDKEFASICSTAYLKEQEESVRDMEQRCEASSSHSQGLPEDNRIMNESKTEPKTREEFLQYACELSLDPTTAHEDLTISEGDKEVMLFPQRCKTPAIRCPQRFIRRRQVLCREELQAERCYYEVDVKGDKMEIALAYKGIDRKTHSKLSAFGANSNSWSLDRSETYSVSHDAQSIKLLALPSHHRIGVYLKFKEGTVSFYEVLDNMKFLYKIEAKFTEPLYPGFWLGDKSCIRICDLKRRRL